MAESTLSLDYHKLREAVGHYLGYGPDSDSWSDAQVREIARCLDAGYRMFLYPPPLPNAAGGHEWSFLKPVRTLVTADGDGTYDLPDDFGGLVGDLTVTGEDSGYWPVKVTGESTIRAYRSGSPDREGRPECAAVRPKAATGSLGQRFELLVWPTPDAAYTLEYAHVALPGALSADRPHPYGGAAHAETLKAACRAAAEQMLDDQQGPQFSAFMQALATSVAVDGRRNRAETLGYNGDPGMGHGRGYWGQRGLGVVVTVNGLTPE